MASIRMRMRGLVCAIRCSMRCCGSGGIRLRWRSMGRRSSGLRVKSLRCFRPWRCGGAVGVSRARMSVARRVRAARVCGVSAALSLARCGCRNRAQSDRDLVAPAEGHNDTLLLAMVLAGFALARRASAFAGALLIALSPLLKAPGAAAAIAFTLVSWHDRARFSKVAVGTILGHSNNRHDRHPAGVRCASASRPAGVTSRNSLCKA